MAVLDVKARRAAFHYQDGRVMGARGLLEAIFGAEVLSSQPIVGVDSRGRRRLKGLLNKTAAVGGKQIIIEFKSGEKYQVMYSGTLVDFATRAVPAMSDEVLCWSTVRGKKRFL